jgi:4'-phosphopantetheinyl transferase
VTADGTTWQSAPDRPTLAAGEVHLWRTSLDHADDVVEACRQVLAQEEADRAKRLVLKKDRDRFIVARAALRRILSRYTGQSPASHRFSYAKHGKPSLEGAGNLRFNLSHSRSLALYAVSLGRELGVDVEYMRRDIDARSIAARFFSADETATLNALPETSQIQAFFHCWTRKEAYIKAIGEGVYFGLDKFDVSLAPGEAAALRRVEGRPDELTRWSLRDLTVHPDYAAAVVGDRVPWILKCWDLSLEM